MKPTKIFRFAAVVLVVSASSPALAQAVRFGDTPVKCLNPVNMSDCTIAYDGTQVKWKYTHRTGGDTVTTYDGCIVSRGKIACTAPGTWRGKTGQQSGPNPPVNISLNGSGKPTGMSK